MKYYKLLTQEEYNDAYFQKGNIYSENYEPYGLCSIAELAQRFPDDWELVENHSETVDSLLSTIKSQLDDIDTKINNLIQLLKCN